VINSVHFIEQPNLKIFHNEFSIVEGGYFGTFDRRLTGTLCRLVISAVAPGFPDLTT